jgi:hypothetical protein
MHEDSDRNMDSLMEDRYCREPEIDPFYDPDYPCDGVDGDCLDGEEEDE